MKRVMFYCSLCFLVVSCTKDQVEIDLNKLELADTISTELNANISVDKQVIDFNQKELIGALLSGKSYTFSSNELTPFLKDKSFEFVKTENQIFIENEELEFNEFVAEKDGISLRVSLIDQEVFELNVMNGTEKFVISNSIYAGKTAAYKDESYMPNTNVRDNKSASEYDIDLLVIGDREYLRADRPNPDRLGSFYLADMVNGARSILESQLPIDITWRIIFPSKEPWDESNTIFEANQLFRDGLANPSIFVTSAWEPWFRARVSKSHVQHFVSGHDLSGRIYNQVHGTASLEGFCNNRRAGWYLEAVPNDGPRYKRDLARALASSLGAKLNYSVENMMNPNTSGDLKEYLLDSSKNQIINMIQNSYCVD